MRRIFCEGADAHDALATDNPIFWEHYARVLDLTPSTLKDAFLETVATGGRFVCLQPNCDNFDDMVGCRGHWALE